MSCFMARLVLYIIHPLNINVAQIVLWAAKQDKLKSVVQIGNLAVSCFMALLVLCITHAYRQLKVV